MFPRLTPFRLTFTARASREQPGTVIPLARVARGLPHACLVGACLWSAGAFAQEAAAPAATPPAAIPEQSVPVTSDSGAVTAPAAEGSPAAPTVAPESVAPAPAASPAAPAEVEAAPPAPALAPAVAEPEQPAAAPAPPTWRFSDSVFSRYEARRGYEGVGKAAHPRFTNMDAMFYRARVGLHLNPVAFGESGTVGVSIEPQASGVQGTTAALSDPNVGMHQAFIDVGTPDYRLQAGRFEMVYGDHLVIGNVGWHQTASAFDGLRLKMKPSGPDGIGLDIFATLVSEGFPASKEPFGAGDKYFLGAYFNDGGLIEGDLDFYLLANMVPSADATVEDPADATMTEVVETSSATEVTLGARLKGAAGAVDYRVEAGYQLGSRPTPAVFGMDNDNVSVSAYQADAEVGFKVSDTGLRLALEGLVASGNDPADETDTGYNHLYPTAHKWLGLADVFGARSNAMGGVGHVAYKASDALSLALDVHLMSRMEEGAADSAFMGTELDTGLVYAIGAGVKARAMYAVVLPNKDFWGDDQTVHFLELELSHNLK